MAARPIFLTVSTVLVVTAVLAGIATLGSPSRIRLERHDRQLVNDLQSLASAIDHHRHTHKQLPDSLNQIYNARSPRIRVKDPASGQPYEYIVKNDASYELCAEFATAGDGVHAGTEDAPFWRHPAGRYCFVLAANRSSPN